MASARPSSVIARMASLRIELSDSVRRISQKALCEYGQADKNDEGKLALAEVKLFDESAKEQVERMVRLVWNDPAYVIG